MDKFTIGMFLVLFMNISTFVQEVHCGVVANAMRSVQERSGQNPDSQEAKDSRETAKELATGKKINYERHLGYDNKKRSEKRSNRNSDANATYLLSDGSSHDVKADYRSVRFKINGATQDISIRGIDALTVVGGGKYYPKLKVQLRNGKIFEAETTGCTKDGYLMNPYTEKLAKRRTVFYFDRVGKCTVTTTLSKVLGLEKIVFYHQE